MNRIMKFNTVLHELRSAKNVGMIARSHLSFGGNFLILIGAKDKWNFKGGSSTYTRKINEAEKLIFFNDFESFLAWNKNATNIAVEISEHAKLSSEYKYPKNCNIILGNERTGLDHSIIEKCDQTVTIPQFGDIGSLNVAVSASIVLYELNKNRSQISKIEGAKFI